MKTTKILYLPLLIFFLMILSVPFQSCEPDDDDDGPVLYKPNIYIYPNEQIDLTVKLNFPMGGHIITSIPEYGSGWNVNVDPSGLIDNTYEYLFYESTQPDVWQKNYGWVTETDKLEIFFRQNMTDFGFSDKEIDDFIEYWIPRLYDYQYYSIYPQTKSIIDDVIQLDFSKKPDNILRLFYVIIGQDQLKDIPQPTIDEFIREGYFVTEWGVILK